MAGAPLQVGRGAIFASFCLTLLGVGCRKDQAKEDAGPPPISAAQKAHCKGGLAPEIPPSVSGFCVDQDTDHRRYGSGTSAPLEAVCTELFNGDCELYRRFGLQRVETFSYVDEANTSRRISVTQSRFDSPLGAYGFFQRRVVGDTDAAALTMTKLAVPTLGVVGAGVSYLWRGTTVWELVFLSELDPPNVIEQLAVQPLSHLAAGLSEKSRQRDETARIVEIVRSIPDAMVPELGVRVEDGELLGRVQSLQFVSASARWKDAEYRLLLAQQRDADAAKDMLVQLVRAPLGEKWERTKPVELHRVLDGSAPEDWSLGVEGRYLLGVSGATEGREVTREERHAFLAALRRSALSVPGRVSPARSDLAPTDGPASPNGAAPMSK